MLSTILRISIFCICLHAANALATDPCHDSDGDGFADPEVATDSCPPDNCPGSYNPDQSICFNVGDPINDGVINVLDVVRSVDHAFRGMLPQADSCMSVLVGGTDVNCDGVTSILDVVDIVGVAFRSATENFCKPCLCDCYPYCAIQDSLNLLPLDGTFERYCQGTIDGWTEPWYSFGNAVLVQEAAPGGGNWGLALLHCWSCGGQIITEVSEAIPSAIYRLSLYTKSYEPSQMYGACVWAYTQFGTYTTARVYCTSLDWMNFEFVDTLPMDQNGPYQIRFAGSSQDDAGGPERHVLIDRISLEYLGQAAP